MNTKNQTNKNENIKIMVLPTLLMMITFFVLIAGATYAYFNVTSTFIGGSSKINSSVESVGVSNLKTGNNLSLNLSRVDMMKNTNDITYYATQNGLPTTNVNNEVIATAEVKGNGIMDCSYELNVDVNGTNNMYAAFREMITKSTNQLVLNVAGVDYDLFNVTFPLTITGKLNGVKEGTSKDIFASFRIINRSNVDQSGIAGTDIELSFSVNRYTCEIVG